ncbi:hypothetical protein BDZ94DRAFT_256391 [Collybia nuda]|uniref:F-box domain-containing protein n=1 Tax=Collybia nuda TaxID=64659 RepID=A0A9P5XX91_9AGAR|nr:hypothetical protein BDZ94DRAFT_256391 [Collybia nuda]
MAVHLQNSLQSLSTIVPYPELPPELVHNIFHYAARRSTPFCLVLCQVSRWTRELALPHLYSTVIIKNHSASSDYIKYLGKYYFKFLQHDFQPTTALRSLWIAAVSDRVVSIFGKCDNVVHLALHADNIFWLVHASSSEWKVLSHEVITRKQDLHITVIDGKNWALTQFINVDPTLTTPLFSKISHLRLAKTKDYETDLTISHFTRLTHLAVPFYLPSHDLSALERTLAHKSLECLVVVIYVDLVTAEDRLRVDNWFKDKWVTGKRVSIVESTSKGIQEEWEEEVRGGKNIWSGGVRSTL